MLVEKKKIDKSSIHKLNTVRSNRSSLHEKLIVSPARINRDFVKPLK